MKDNELATSQEAWYTYGNTAQRPQHPKTGDRYLDTEADTYYACFTDGTWTVISLAGAGGVVVEDEGVVQGTATTLDFTGAGVTASYAAGQATINVPDAGNTLDEAYDQGGAGAGRTIIVDTGAVNLEYSALDATHLLEVRKTGDTQPTFNVEASGDLEWGVGGSTASDLTLRRTGVAEATLSTPGGAAATLKINELKEQIANGRVQLPDGTWVQSAFSLHAASAALSAGTLTATQPWMVVTAQTGLTDDMDSLSPSGIGPINGDYYLITPTDTYTITIRDNSVSGGNISTADGNPIVLDTKEKVALLLRYGTTYYAMPLFVASTHAGSAHHAQSHDLEDTSSHTTSSGVDGHVLRQTTATTFAFEPDYFTVNYVIDGGGSAITTGVKGDVELPSDGVIEEWRLLPDQSGSIDIQIWKDTYANFPPTVADQILNPTIVANTKNEATGLSQAVSAEEILRFNVNGAATSITRCTVVLKIRKT